MEFKNSIKTSISGIYHTTLGIVLMQMERPYDITFTRNVNQNIKFCHVREREREGKWKERY
jgi:hypothetical protein